MTSSRLRRTGAALCGGVGVLLIVLAVVLGYARRVLFDERAFSNRVAASLADANVAAYAAEKLADGVCEVKPDLVGVRPLIVGVARSVVSSPPFRAAVRSGARTLHKAVMDGTGRDVVLTVKDIGLLVETTAAEQPKLAKKIPPKVSAAIGHLKSLPGGERAAQLLVIARRMRLTAIGLLLLGIGFCALAVWLSREKRWAMVRIGLTLGGIGLILVIVARFGPWLVLLENDRPPQAPALVGLLRAFLLPLVVWGMALSFGGVVLASASASLLERVPLLHWGRRTAGWFFGTQERMRFRLLRGLLGVIVGACILAWPIPALTVLAWLAAVIALFIGLREAFYAALHLLPEMTPRGRLPGAEKRARIGPLPAILVSVAAIALIVATIYGVQRATREPEGEREITLVNGSAFLPDRTVDQVVFPCTHNAMGGGDDPSWMFPNQSAGIRAQLEDGIRAFMIDVHHAVPVGDRVKTILADESKSLAKYEAVLGEEGMKVAIRIRDRLVGQEEGKPGIYMCHGLCELGGLPFVPALKEMHEFLADHPDEVVIIIIQDEEVSPQDVAKCFEESGLDQFVYRGPLGPPWPTMRELVETDQRVIVFAENQWEGVDWYHSAFATFQETPYTFHDPSEFTNKPNRGGTSGALYLMNHWIESTPMPKPTNAEIVNAHDALMARITDFEKTRGHLPNLVAVDFYKSGDLVQVCRELNERTPETAEAAPSRR